MIRTLSHQRGNIPAILLGGLLLLLLLLLRPGRGLQFALGISPVFIAGSLSVLRGFFEVVPFIDEVRAVAHYLGRVKGMEGSEIGRWVVFQRCSPTYTPTRCWIRAAIFVAYS